MTEGDSVPIGEPSNGGRRVVLDTKEEKLITTKNFFRNTGMFQAASDDFVGTATGYYFDHVKDTPRSYRETIVGIGHDEIESTVIFDNSAGIAGETVTPFRSGSSFPVNSYYSWDGYKIVNFKNNIGNNLIIRGEQWVSMFFDPNGLSGINECLPKLNKLPPPPLKPTMRCCPDNSAILRQILKIVKENKEAIGVEDLPANLPASFLKLDGKESGQVDKPNLIQILGWYFERFDEVLGQFEIEVEIEDADATQEGNQERIVKLPNVAESLAEITMMLLSLMYNSDLTVNLATSGMIEAGQTKIEAYKVHEMVETIVDYLGYQVDYENEKVPLSYTPGKESFE